MRSCISVQFLFAFLLLKVKLNTFLYSSQPFVVLCVYTNYLYITLAHVSSRLHTFIFNFEALLFNCLATQFNIFYIKNSVFV